MRRFGRNAQMSAPTPRMTSTRRNENVKGMGSFAFRVTPI